MSVELSKSNLLNIKKKVKTYNGFLPALNMRKQQILIKLSEVEKEYKLQQEKLKALKEKIITELPMLATTKIDLEGFVSLDKFSVTTVNIVGIEVPVIDEVLVNIHPHEITSLPFWMPRYIELMKEYYAIISSCKVLTEQKDILKKASIKVTQKINLFEKVLLPKSYADMKKIKIYLGDAERAQVVSCKLAKKMGNSE